MTALTDGPALVWRGDHDAADVVAVLDPAGEASHGELPATWRPVADRLLVGWVRLPADGAGIAAIDSALSRLDGQRAHVVTSGPATEVALWIAATHTAVASFLVVDPEPCDGSLDGADGSARARWWDALPGRAALARADVEVKTFYSDGLELCTAAPAPLGLPEVVAWVERALADESNQPGAGTPTRSPRDWKGAS